MNGETLVAVAALLVSLFSLRYTWIAQRDQSQHAAIHANMAALVDLYRSIATPSILRFHGVSEKDLADAGVTADEFAYLLASFEAASVYYRYYEQASEPFEENSLRYQLLATDATRRAWPLLSRFFGEDTSYRKRIEATLRLFDSRAMPSRPER